MIIKETDGNAKSHLTKITLRDMEQENELMPIRP
jgi:hypothetical protein